MIADFFTKPLQGSTFTNLRDVVMGTKHYTTLRDLSPCIQERVGNYDFGNCDDHSESRENKFMNSKISPNLDTRIEHPEITHGNQGNCEFGENRTRKENLPNDLRKTGEANTQNDSTDQDSEKKTKETKMTYAEVVGKNTKNVLNCKQVDVVPRRIHWDPTVKYKETSSSKDRWKIRRKKRRT